MKAGVSKRQVTALVVGGSSKIGLAIVCRLAARGDSVIATHRGSGGRRLDNSAEWVRLDLQDEKAIGRFAKQLAKRGKSLDAAIFVAGILPGKSLENYSVREMNSVMDINFLGQAKCIKAILPMMNTPSLILMFSSISGERGSYDPIYAASKGAVTAFAKSLATWLPPRVRCLSIAPGLIAGTRMHDAMSAKVRNGHRRRTPLKKLMTARELAAVVGDLTMEHWAFANGTCVRINGGAYV